MSDGSSEKKVGFIAGCFDPFPHPGQIWAMKQAIDAGVCESIYIAMHVDPSVQRPEKSRMFCTLEERRLMLESLRWTEKVIPYELEDDLVRILRELKPDVRILGDDYKGRDYTGSELNIPIFYSERREGWSGTDFRNRIMNGEYIDHPQSAS